jgi:hypothetical protein
MNSAVEASMADVLSAVAGELGLARHACARLDGALGELLSAAPAEHRGAVMHELHAVDLLNQQIAALAGFVERLSGGTSGGIMIEVGQALGGITLGEVAARLGAGVGAPPAQSSMPADDIDFF